MTVPFVDIEGPGTLSGRTWPRKIVAQPSGPTNRRSGLGDVSVGAAFIILREGTILPRLEIAGVVKVPSAANGLGTGQTDYGVQMTFHRRLLRGVTSFGSLGYQRIGDPNTLQLHNGERATVGLDINYSNWGGGALLDYQKSLFPGVPNSFTVDPYVTVPFVRYRCAGLHHHCANSVAPTTRWRSPGFVKLDRSIPIRDYKRAQGR